jgi:DNA-binding MarR family transcriptional regulator
VNKCEGLFVNSGATENDKLDTDQKLIVLGLLDAVERNPALTQRSISRELGIALGLANAYLRRCVRKGLIKVSQVPSRRYAYFLTPQGFAEKARLTADYLTYSFAFFRRARAQCGDLLDVAARKGQRRIACIGAGDLAEILALVAREKQDIEFAGVLGAADAAMIKTEASKLGRVDAVVITAIEDPREIFAAALAVFGADRVYAPELLKVHARSDGNGATE